MQIWDTLLGSATEIDLLRLGEALAVGTPPRTAMGVLQTLLREAARPGLARLGSPVSLDYFDRRPFAFDGTIDSVKVVLWSPVAVAGCPRWRQVTSTA
jgi:hypothetical protein